MQIEEESGMQIDDEESCSLGVTSSPLPSDASATLATAAPARLDVTPAAAESPDESSLRDLLQEQAANLLQQLDAEGEIEAGLPVKIGKDTPSVCCCSAAPLIHLPRHIKLLIPAPLPDRSSMPHSSTSAQRSRSDRSSGGAGPMKKTLGMSQSGYQRCGG